MGDLVTREDSLRIPDSISVVVPVYNEEESIQLLYEKIRNTCEQLGKPYEIVFVDDGSRDRTFPILESIYEQDRHVRVVRFGKNYGQTAAMTAGFEYARGKVIFSMDGDLQNDPVDIPRLLAKIEEGYDVVCGWRKNRQDKFWTRRVPSMVANWIIARVTGVNIHDNGCSLKAYRSSVIKGLELYNEMHRFIPAMSTIAGTKIAEIVVSHHARRFGNSKYGISRTWRVILDIITVKMLTGFADRPMIWFGFLSLPVIFLSGLFLFIALGMYLGQSIEEWIVLSTIGLLFLFLGGHLLAMGIIGELSVITGDYSPRKSLNPTIVIE